jgi:hypothetical protein
MLQNVHRVDGDAAYVSLTQGQETVIDAVDLPLVLPYRWYASYIPHMKGYYARATAPGGERLMMHRLLLQPGPGEWVDHQNHDTLDNRRSNIQVVSPSGNAQNRWSHNPNYSTGVLGVSIQEKPDGRRYYVATAMRERRSKRRNFPYTPQGLEEATALAARWREDFSYEPDRSPRPRPERNYVPPVRSSTGIRGVSIQRDAYHFRCFSNRCPDYKRFPYTPEGLEQARAYSAIHHTSSTITDT